MKRNKLITKAKRLKSNIAKGIEMDRSKYAKKMKTKMGKWL